MSLVSLLFIISLEKIAALEEMTPQDAVPSITENIYIPLITKATESGFWTFVKEGANEAAQDYDIEISFEGTPRGAEVKDQLDLIEAALARNPQAIILSALDSSAVRPYLESAQAAGIPIIGFDSGVDSPIVRTTVATDNYGAGAVAADKMAQLIGEEGKVGLIVLDRTSKVGIDRSDGFVDTMRLKYPNIEVLPVEYGEGSLGVSQEAAKRMIRENPDIKGMFGANEDSAIGILEAVEESGKEDEITIIGFDAGRVAQAVREGRIAGAILQNTREIGYRAVETAYRAYRGERMPEFINVDFNWYDSTNIDSPEIQALIYD